MAERWYYCLKHEVVEPEAGCANWDRLGPYASQEEAAEALALAARRNEAWAAGDEDDDD